MMQTKKPYIIDTNILINFRIYTPMNIHIIFWEQLSEIIREGKIIIKDVADECTRRKLKNWVNKQRIEQVPDGVYKRAAEINNKYQLITQEGQFKKSEADPVIIAYAEIHSGIVFTQEAKRKSDSEPRKIPDVCKALRIQYQRWPDNVFEDIKFKEI